MERRSQDRDIIGGGGMSNSMNSYNPPPHIGQETPVKLPLAPIVSTLSDRRGNATVSTRRGSSIFSPTTTTHTLDHHHHPPPPQRLAIPHKDPTPDPDPNPVIGSIAASSSKNPSSPPVPPQPSPFHHQQTAAAAVIRYRECLKNHAASIGGHVVDGCGEFMPSGDDGTPESLRCAACDCHRNFHRRELDGEPQHQQPSHFYTYNPTSVNNHHHPRNTPPPHGQAPPSISHKHSQGFAGGGLTPVTMMNFGAGNSGGRGAAAESSSEDLNMFQSSGSGGHAVIQSGSKKRFRTKFSQEQKERMQEFAAELGWSIQKQKEEEVQQFCNEVGVKRQVFKVWMHNNKQAMKKRQM